MSRRTRIMETPFEIARSASIPEIFAVTKVREPGRGREQPGVR